MLFRSALFDFFGFFFKFLIFFISSLDFPRNLSQKKKEKIMTGRNREKRKEKVRKVAAAVILTIDVSLLFF